MFWGLFRGVQNIFEVSQIDFLGEFIKGFFGVIFRAILQTFPGCFEASHTFFRSGVLGIFLGCFR